MAGVGHLKRIFKDAFRVAVAVQKTMFIRDVRRSGRWFPERGCILEHQIFRFAEMILRDRCSTSLWPGINVLWQAQYFRQVEWKKSHNALVRGRQLCTQLSEVSQNCLVYWCCQDQKLKKSRRIASFWMLSSSKIEEVSQNCFVLDVVKFKKMKKSRRIVSFLMLSTSKNVRKSRRITSFLMFSTLKNEEVTQNCCVFDVVKFKTWGRLAE